ncbi:MAG TPA: hypothetical protein VGP06_18035 [Janthinobacterium sp.]|nr:hypothetical protein [Janthinobacterium sp.]
MNTTGRALAVALALAGLALAGPASAQQAPVVEHTPVAVPPPPQPKVPATRSDEEADAKLADVKARRAAVEAKYIDDERACYDKFFATNCIDKIKETRRVTLAGLRAIEVEASHFKRAYAVEKRDQALLEQDRKMQADAAERAARAAAPPKAPEARQEARPDALTPAQRKVQHAAKVKRQQAQDAADAGKRAANAAAFEKKQLTSAQHERDLEVKQAAKAEKLRKKEADDAAAAAADAAAAAAAAKKK